MIGLNRLNIDEEAVVAKIGEKKQAAQGSGTRRGNESKNVC